MVYMNNSTGEITHNHYEAMEWFRAGVNVTLWNEKNPAHTCSWTH